MMETAGASISLQSELEDIIQTIHRGEKFNCFGRSIKEVQCGRKISKVTQAKLAALLAEVLNLLENAGKDVDTLLEKASRLVMCVPYHQNQSAAKFKEWSLRIPAKNLKLAHGGGVVEQISLAPTIELSNDVSITGPLSMDQKSDSPNLVDTQKFDRNSSSKSPLPTFSNDFDDSGVESGDEGDIAGNQAVSSRVTRAEASSSSAEYANPRTPQKVAKPASTDSGISMYYDKSDKAQEKRSIKHGAEPESPSTGKGSREKQVTEGTWPLRPATTPIQPKSLPIRPKRSLSFKPFDDSFVKTRSYINKPLSGKDDMKEGYIYGFQLEGCAFTKIGCAPERDSEPSIQASFDARLKEHKSKGWPDLKIVLKKRVPHVHRVEKLIHYHLGAGRMKEQCSCKSSTGRKLNHGNHTEWFSNSLDEIYTVVIAWSHWISTVPYVLDGGRYHLTPEWKICLSNVRDQCCRDNWLEWLFKYVPELRRSIHNVTQDTNGCIENEETPEDDGSFVRSSATGIKTEIKKARTFNY